MARRTQTASFAFVDANGFPVGYVYLTSQSGALGTGGSYRMTRDQARRVAPNIAKLPTLLGVKPTTQGRIAYV